MTEQQRYSGAIEIGKKTRRVALAYMKRVDRPVTAAELAQVINRSAPTTYTVLREIGAVADDSWPRRWALPSKAAIYFDEQIGDSDQNVLVPVITDESNWVMRWNKARERVGLGVAKLELAADSDPDDLLEQFTTAAKSLASVALALQRVKDYPDWYTMLGGEPEEVLDDGDEEG